MCHAPASSRRLSNAPVQAVPCLQTPQPDVFQSRPASRLLCELCKEAACVFCQADEALLCGSCDVKVHTANFLVSRHVRAVLCSVCSSDTYLRVCGARPSVVQVQCAHCCTGAGGVQGMLWHSAAQNGKALPHSAGACPPEMMGASLVQVTVEAPGPRCWVPEKVISVARDARDPAVEASGCGATLATQDRAPHSPVSVLSLEQGGKKRLREDSEASSPATPVDSDRLLHRGAKRSRGGSGSDSESVGESGEEDVAVAEGEEDAVSSASDEESSSGPVETPTIGSRRRHIGQSAAAMRESRPGCSSAGVAHHQPASLGEQAAARLQRVLARWHKDLHLTGAATCDLAFHLVKRALRRLQPCTMATDALRITLATCLWLAVKLEEPQSAVPKAGEVARVAGVVAARLTAVEGQLLALLDWRPLEGWVKREEEPEC